MNRATIFFVILVTGLLSCRTQSREGDSPNKTAEGFKQGTQSTDAWNPVPADNAEFIKSHDLGRLLAGAEDSICDYPPPMNAFTDSCYCRADFDGNGETDYATFLVDRECVVSLFAFHRLGGTLVAKKVYAFQKYEGESYYVAIEPKGRWDGEGGAMLHVVHDGLWVSKDMDTEYSFFWNGKEYVRF